MRIPYGYVLKEHQFVVDEKTAAVVRMIFEYYLAGASLGKVVDLLSEKGIVSPTGNAASRRTRILRQTSRCGLTLRCGWRWYSLCGKTRCQFVQSKDKCLKIFIENRGREDVNQMIKHIKLHGIATYTDPVEINLKDINFIYGGNGTGKTTISKLISGEIQHPSCSVDLDGAMQDSILVYNKSFVEKNFREVDNIEGIFTLGSEASEILDAIKVKESELENVNNQISGKHSSINGIKQDIAAIEAKFNDDCWAVQIKYGMVFPKAMTGTRNAKSAFSKKCLKVYDSPDRTSAKSIDELQTLYYAAYSKEAAKYEPYQQIDLLKAADLDHNVLLAKQITGKADSDIGRFIEYLGASDWVKQGIVLTERTNGKVTAK